MENKTIIKNIRSQLINGQPGNRTLLLAYAFLKNRPYITLESKINEDHPSFGKGREAFLDYLSHCINKTILSIDTTSKNIKDEIYQWIMTKYQTSEIMVEETAA
jgi:hypothetical protein